MVIFLHIFSFILIAFEFVSFEPVSFIKFNINFYFFYLLLFLINFFFYFKKKKFNLDIFIPFLVNLNLISMYVFNEVRKFLFFLKNFRYDYIRFYNFYIYYYNLVFIIWRPLFKKWSYFGYFRSNRSKWIK